MSVRCTTRRFLISIVLMWQLSTFFGTAVLFAAAACTNLGDVTPAASSTYTITSGQCPGDITISNTKVTIVFQPGAGWFQTGKGIRVTANPAIELKVEVKGVNWNTVGSKMFPATPVYYEDSVFLFQDSTIVTSGVNDPFGLGQFSQGGKMTRTSYTINRCTISITAAIGMISGIYFWERHDNSKVVILHSVISVSGNGNTFGLYFWHSKTSSKVIIENTTMGVSTTGYPCRGIFWGSLSGGSSFTMSDSKVTSAANGGNGHAQGVMMNAAITDGSTITWTNTEVTATSVGSGAADPMYFSSSLAGGSTVTIDGCSSTATATSSHGSSYGLSFLGSAVSTIVLKRSTFVGTSSNGPLRSSAVTTSASGSLSVQCVKWNGATLNLTTLGYTSPSLTLIDEGQQCTATKTGNSESSTRSPTVSQTSSRITQSLSGKSRTQSPSISESRSQHSASRSKFTVTPSGFSQTTTAEKSPSSSAMKTATVTFTVSSSRPETISQTTTHTWSEDTKTRSNSEATASRSQSKNRSSTPTPAEAASFTPSETLTETDETGTPTHVASTTKTISKSEASWSRSFLTTSRTFSSRTTTLTLIPPTPVPVVLSCNSTTPTNPPTQIHLSDQQLQPQASSSSQTTGHDLDSLHVNFTAPSNPWLLLLHLGNNGARDPSSNKYNYTLRVKQAENEQPNPKGFASGGFKLGTNANLTQVNNTLFELSLSTSTGYRIEADEVINVILEPQFFEDTDAACLPQGDMLIAQISISATPNAAAIATKEATTAVTAAATVAGIMGSSGAALDAQSLAVMGLLSCAQPGDRQSMKNNRLLSPLATGDTYEAMILGNWALVTGVSGIHFLIVVALKILAKHATTWEEAGAKARFPSFTIAVLFVQFQGTAAAAIKILQTPTSGPSSLALGALTILFSALLPPLCLLVVYWVIDATFHKYHYEHASRQHSSSSQDSNQQQPGSGGGSDGDGGVLLLPPAAPATATVPDNAIMPASAKGKEMPVIHPVATLFLPKGKWMPLLIRQRFGSLFGGIGRYEKIWTTLPSWSPMVMVLALMVRPDTQTGCTALFSVMCVLEFLIAGIILAFRPLRCNVSNFLSASSNICLGFVVMGLAIQSQDPASTTAATFTRRGVQAQIAVTLSRLIWTFTRFCIERLVLSRLMLVPQDPDGVWVGWGTIRKSRRRIANINPSTDIELTADELDAVLLEAMDDEPTTARASPQPDPQRMHRLLSPLPVSQPEPRMNSQLPVTSGFNILASSASPEPVHGLGNNRAFHDIWVDPELLAHAERQEAALMAQGGEDDDGEGDEDEEVEMKPEFSALLQTQGDGLACDDYDPLSARTKRQAKKDRKKQKKEDRKEKKAATVNTTRDVAPTAAAPRKFSLFDDDDDPVNFLNLPPPAARPIPPPSGPPPAVAVAAPSTPLPELSPLPEPAALVNDDYEELLMLLESPEATAVAAATAGANAKNSTAAINVPPVLVDRNHAQDDDDPALTARMEFVL